MSSHFLQQITCVQQRTDDQGRPTTSTKHISSLEVTLTKKLFDSPRITILNPSQQPLKQKQSKDEDGLSNQAVKGHSNISQSQQMMQSLMPEIDGTVESSNRGSQTNSKLKFRTPQSEEMTAKMNAGKVTNSNSAPIYSQQQLIHQESVKNQVKKPIGEEYQAEMKHVQRTVNSEFKSEQERMQCMKKCFQAFKKLRILQSLEKAIQLTESDTQKYFDSWMSKAPEPVFSHTNSNQYHMSSYQGSVGNLFGNPSYQIRQ